MNFYPIGIRLNGKRVLVIGGGEVAERKLLSLLSFSSEITVISPQATAEISELAHAKKINLLRRRFAADDLKDCAIVFSATDDAQLNREVYELAKKNNILINTADAPELCDFILPAVLRRGPLSISILTDGTCPGLARHIRERLEPGFGKEYEILVSLIGAIRKKVYLEHKGVQDFSKNLKDFLQEMDWILQRLQQQDFDPVEDYVEKIFAIRCRVKSS